MEFILPPQQSEKLDQLLPAFAAAQIDYPDFIKNRSGQFKYMDLVELVGTVKPILSKHKLLVHHKQYPMADGSRVLGTILYHFPSGQYVESRSWITIDQGGKRSSHQEFGIAMSYHRRYELMALLNLTPEDESDNDGGPVKRRDFHQEVVIPKEVAPGKASEAQLKYLHSLLLKKNFSIKEFCTTWNVESLEELSKEFVSQTIKKLQS